MISYKLTIEQLDGICSGIKFAQHSLVRIPVGRAYAEGGHQFKVVGCDAVK